MTIGWPYTSSHVVLDTERGGAVPQEHSDLLKRMRTKITGSVGIVYVSLFWFPLSALCLGVLVRASLVCLFVCVHGHLTRAQSCSRDYRAVTLNCALLFFYPGVKLFFLHVLCCGGCVILFSIQVGFEHEFGCNLRLSLLPWAASSLERWWRSH